MNYPALYAQQLFLMLPEILLLAQLNLEKTEGHVMQIKHKNTYYSNHNRTLCLQGIQYSEGKAAGDSSNGGLRALGIPSEYPGWAVA